MKTYKKQLVYRGYTIVIEVMMNFKVIRLLAGRDVKHKIELSILSPEGKHIHESPILLVSMDELFPKIAELEEMSKKQVNEEIDGSISEAELRLTGMSFKPCPKNI